MRVKREQDLIGAKRPAKHQAAFTEREFPLVVYILIPLVTMISIHGGVMCMLDLDLRSHAAFSPYLQAARAASPDLSF